jgi:hypothetical protein
MSNILISESPQQLLAPEPLPTLILGGGFTGLFTALHLSRQHYTTPTILIDREWNFIFKPLLYEFLSGEMNMQLSVIVMTLFYIKVALPSFVMRCNRLTYNSVKSS